MPRTGGETHGLHYASLQNNAARWWFQDAGLRKWAVTYVVGVMGTINNGYDGSLINGLLANPIFVNDIGNPDGNKLGLISAAYSLGGLIGTFGSPWLADRFGRRACILVGALFIICGALVQTFTTGGWPMFGGRLILGFGVTYQFIGGGPLVAETAHPRNRAQATALINTSWYIGSIIAAWTTFGALNMKGSWSWRIGCLIQAVPCCLQLCGLYFAVESPRWLISKGREEEALQILANLHANGDINDELVRFEFEEVKEAIAMEKAAQSGVSLKSFFQTKGNRKRLTILISLAFFSQWVGNGIISYYLAKILKSVGITDPSAQAGFNGGLQIFNWFAAVASALLNERLGRRFLLITCMIGMLCSYIIITACSAVYAKHEIMGAGRAVMAMLFVYFGFYDFGFCLTIAYPLEILSFALRTKGMALLQFTIFLASFFNQYVNPIALNAIAWKYYFIYIGVQLFALGFIYFYYPETKGRMLEEVAEIFDGPAAILPAAQALDDAEEKAMAQDVQVERVKA